jgi:hypothetical protein
MGRMRKEIKKGRKVPDERSTTLMSIPWRCCDVRGAVETFVGGLIEQSYGQATKEPPKSAAATTARKAQSPRCPDLRPQMGDGGQESKLLEQAGAERVAIVHTHTNSKATRRAHTDLASQKGSASP